MSRNREDDLDHIARALSQNDDPTDQTRANRGPVLLPALLLGTLVLALFFATYLVFGRP